MKRLSYILIAQVFIFLLLDIFIDLNIWVVRMSALSGVIGFILHIIEEEKDDK